MIYNVFTIFNLDTKEFSAPFLEKTVNIATDKFLSELEKSAKENKRFAPRIFKLYHMGTFDIISGKMELINKVMVVSGEILEEEENE